MVKWPTKSNTLYDLLTCFFFLWACHVPSKHAITNNISFMLLQKSIWRLSLHLCICATPLVHISCAIKPANDSPSVDYQSDKDHMDHPCFLYPPSIHRKLGSVTRSMTKELKLHPTSLWAVHLGTRANPWKRQQQHVQCCYSWSISAISLMQTTTTFVAACSFVFVVCCCRTASICPHLVALVFCFCLRVSQQENQYCIFVDRDRIIIVLFRPGLHMYFLGIFSCDICSIWLKESHMQLFKSQHTEKSPLDFWSI